MTSPTPVPSPPVVEFLRRHPVVPLTLIGLVPFALYARGVRALGGWLVDDALISMAYARSIADGGVYAQTTHDVAVEGVSNPLWTLLLAGLRGLGLFDAGRQAAGHSDYVWVFWLLAGLCFAGITVALLATVYRAFSWKGAAAAGFALVLLATSTPFVVWTASGLENPLYALLVTLLATSLWSGFTTHRLTSPRLALPAALYAALAALVRPDGLVYAAAYPVVLLIAQLTERERERELPCGRRSAVWRGSVFRTSSSSGRCSFGAMSPSAC